jgi:uncharacterized membrane protein YphA (DoxX/SURF4 family)
MENLLTIQNLGWLLTAVTVVMMAKGVLGKIMGSTEMVGNFNYMKLSNHRVAVGVGELVGLLLLVYPATSAYGAILIACFMSGAVALHLSLMGGNKTYVPVLVGSLAILSHILRTIH